MIVRIGVEEQDNGAFKAFVPGLEWAWAVSASTDDSVRRLKIIFFAMFADELANNPKQPAPTTVTFAVDLLPKAKPKAEADAVKEVTVPPAALPTEAPQSAESAA